MVHPKIDSSVGEQPWRDPASSGTQMDVSWNSGHERTLAEESQSISPQSPRSTIPSVSWKGSYWRLFMEKNVIHPGEEDPQRIARLQYTRYDAMTTVHSDTPPYATSHYQSIQNAQFLAMTPGAFLKLLPPLRPHSAEMYRSAHGSKARQHQKASPKNCRQIPYRRHRIQHRQCPWA